uniref:DUF2232 domain-containing protein n=1 Tax=Cyanothece sp. (strain PCC 7425 / ATCC 29141) TaxID=395961 RepID=B8HST6_CYAP4
MSHDPLARGETPTDPEMEFMDLEFDSPPDSEPMVPPRPQIRTTLAIVETAFLASTAALIWLINFYFPLGPLLRIFFPVPIALAYLRWNLRTATMTALVAALLLSVLMGPPRSLQFLVPHGLLGILLGHFWQRRASWWVSIAWGALLGGIGLFFQIGLLSLLLGENLWLYLNQQVTNLLDWLFTSLGWLVQPDLAVVQAVAVLIVFFNATLYTFVVHLAAWLLLERVGNPIPPPPQWLQTLLEQE